MRSAAVQRELPRLLVFSDCTRASEQEIVSRLGALCERARRGSVAIVVRDYQLSVRARLELGRELATRTLPSGQALGVADRADLASLLGATLLHLPERGLLPADARRLLGDRALLSRACHQPEQVGSERCDLVVLSPVIAPRKGAEPLGLAGLARARARLERISPRPALLALGGVDAGSAAACLAAGADGVAVIGAALAPEPLPLLAALGIARSG